MKREELKSLLHVSKLSKEPQVWLTQGDALAFGEQVTEAELNRILEKIKLNSEYGDLTIVPILRRIEEYIMKGEK